MKLGSALLGGNNINHEKVGEEFASIMSHLIGKMTPGEQGQFTTNLLSEGQKKLGDL